jgi:hypothetical protein
MKCVVLNPAGAILRDKEIEQYFVVKVLLSGRRTFLNISA